MTLKPGSTPRAKRVRRSPFRRKAGHPPTHGAHMLTRVLRTVPFDTIDKRSRVGVALRRIQEDLTTQLGGPDEITPALALLIEQAAIKAVITQAVGEWVLKQDSPVRHDKDGAASLMPVVVEHDRLQLTLARLLETVGLQRRAKPVQDIRQQLGLD